LWNQRQNHEDDSYRKHLPVDCFGINVTIADRSDRDDEEVDHVVELIPLRRYQTVLFDINILFLAEFPDRINIFYVLIFERQH
jgi:hypothetical protein